MAQAGTSVIGQNKEEVRGEKLEKVLLISLSFLAHKHLGVDGLAQEWRGLAGVPAITNDLSDLVQVTSPLGLTFPICKPELPP